MAEDLVELGMEAVAPITDHHEKVDEPLLIPSNRLCLLTPKFPGLAESQEHGQGWL